MGRDAKPVVDKEQTFDLLEIRLGRVVSAEIEQASPKKAFRLKVDFGKFGVKTSVGRFTGHSPEDIIGRQVMGVLNFPPRRVGDTISECLILGVQYPKAESGEATFVTPAVEAKLGSKLF